MFNRRRHREVPQLNTTSTADISFMLLVFFLVTSSMDSDKALGRRLPPVDKPQQEQQDISRSNVLQIRLDADDRLFCNDQVVSHAELTRQVEAFVASRQTDRYMIAVETDRATSYNAYFEMQDAVVHAYHQLRDKMARQHYGHSLSHCTREERDAVMRRYPQRISEGMAATSTAAIQKGGQP